MPEGLEIVRVSYDPEADAAYITLIDRELQPGESAHQSDTIDAPGDRGTLIADFETEGRLLGIEVLAARSVLPVNLLPAEHRPTS